MTDATEAARPIAALVAETVIAGTAANAPAAAAELPQIVRTVQKTPLW